YKDQAGKTSKPNPSPMSPGASKPATDGRFKTSHISSKFRTRQLILTGPVRCSRCHAVAGLVFPDGTSSPGAMVRPLSGPSPRPLTPQSPSPEGPPEPVGALAGFEPGRPPSDPVGALAGFESPGASADSPGRSRRR